MKIRLFRTSDNYHHHFRHWTAQGAVPRGYVVALHGIQSHSGWYDYSSQRISAAGFDVRFLDRRGSGLNGCHRGHTPHYERLIHDVRQFLAHVKEERDSERPGAPVILAGISWGGKVATATAIRNPDLMDGLALLYPGICARMKPNWWQVQLMNLGISLGKGRERVKIPLDDPTLFTGEKDWQEFIRNDRYTIHQVTLDFLKASLDLEQLIQSEATKLKLPLLMMLAGQDEIIDNEETLRLLSQFGSVRENLILYNNARHTLEFERNRHEIFSDFLEWLNHLCRGEQSV